MTLLDTLLGKQDVNGVKYKTEAKRLQTEWDSFLSQKSNRFSELKFLEDTSTKTNHPLLRNESDWWFTRQWDSSLYQKNGFTKKISLVIKPLKSIVEEPGVIADYIATRVEISTPIQTVFNEIIRAFEQEVQCIGSDFEVGANSKQLESDNEEAKTSVLYPEIIVEGFKLKCSGRIQVYPRSKPAEKAESIQISRGNLPLNTMYENIQYAQTKSTNDYGTCGIKVWVNYASK
jgi:hypothetical protein